MPERNILLGKFDFRNFWRYFNISSICHEEMGLGGGGGMAASFPCPASGFCIDGPFSVNPPEGGLRTPVHPVSLGDIQQSSKAPKICTIFGVSETDLYKYEKGQENRTKKTKAEQNVNRPAVAACSHLVYIRK